jgi:DNA-binding response OmpR family regulator
VLILDPKIRRRLSLMMQRVLIVDPEPVAARALSDLMRQIAPCQVWTATDGDGAMHLAGRIDPHIVLVELAADGGAFVADLRRSSFACRMAPVIMLAWEVTARGIISARDAGANELLRRPCTIEALVDRIRAGLFDGREWIETAGYVGPDRRRFNAGDCMAATRRRNDGPPDAAAA